MLPTARHHCDISSKGAALRGRNDAEMGPANSLHASAYYSEYNERFDFDLNFRFKPSPFRKLSVKCQTRPRLLIFHSTISLSRKKFLFRKFLMTSLHVIFGLPSPNQKSWLRQCTKDGISSRVPQNHCLSSPSESKLL